MTAPLTEPWLIAHGFLPDGDNGAGELALRIWAWDETECYGEYPAMQIICADGSIWLESYGPGGETLCLVELPIDYTQEALMRLCDGMGQKLREVKE